MATAEEILSALVEMADPERAAGSEGFFKTGKGGYGEGDRFLGIPVPKTRLLVRRFRGSEISSYEELLNSPLHEARLFSLIALGEEFKRAGEDQRKIIFDLYMKNTHRVNNWDLVDTSAPHIAGAWLYDRSRKPLYKLAVSTSIWDRRISVIATQFFIRKGDFSDTLKISDILLNDREDLIHKAVGWMLREVGNRDRKTEEDFLRTRYKVMPRTMLRYAIEKFEPDLRKRYLRGLI